MEVWMEVHQAFRRRGTDDPKVHGILGNDSLDNMLKEYPMLTPLVQQLQAWHGLRSQGGGLGGTREWSALFFFDHVHSKPTQITLEIHPSRRTLMVPSIPINLEEGVPTIVDVVNHALRNIRPRPKTSR
jgi:hypothetical protein